MMKTTIRCGFTLLILGLAALACETETPSSPCFRDRDCPDGRSCVEGICVVRLDGGTQSDTGGDAVLDTSDDPASDEGADLPADPIADLDIPSDRQDPFVEDWIETHEPAVDSDLVSDGVDLISDIPCQEREELCDGLDNNCNDLIDEEGICDDLDVGIRIELSWDAQPADLDLHFLNGDGVFGSRGDFDPNDCYYANANPEWGDDRSQSDNPQFWGDIHQGGDTPEVVTIKQPADEFFRILVYYFGSRTAEATPVNAQVDIYLDSELVETRMAGTERFPDDGYFWNVACVNYRTEEVLPLDQFSFRPDLPPADACADASCETACDCPQGHSCVDGTCSAEATGVYCCENPDCPLGQSCQFSDESQGLCGNQIDFDHDLVGAELEIDVDVEALYSQAGVLFSTDRDEATVMTNPYELISESRGNSCATRDDASSSTDPVYWLGNVTATFVMPNDEGFAQAATHFISMYIGQTWWGGIQVEYFDTAGELIDSRVTGELGTVYVEFESETPIGSVDVHPSSGTASDPDFAIDDLQFGPIFVP